MGHRASVTSTCAYNALSLAPLGPPDRSRIAADNHWSAVKYLEPRLVETQKAFGVQLYEVRFKPQERKIPLPNTCQPYMQVEVKASVR